MKSPVLVRRQWRGSPWDIVLAVAIGIVVFAVLSVVSARILVPAVTAIVGIFLFGLIHYFFWGQRTMEETSRGRRQAEILVRPQVVPIVPEEEITLVLNDRERAELIDFLDRSLKREAALSQEMTLSHRNTIQEILTRLRGYGA